ncbi:MAG: cation:proton antiporter [Candidatus Nanopelagicales bacterium]|jgi:NhaP-type Na+/H+ or K+/H+ antiporter|nr:cation:proton antiporter [Candidatus Nanopelagicales bacterium]
MGPALVAFAALLVGFCAFAHRLGRWNVTAPIVFVLAGSAVGFTVDSPAATEVIWVRAVAEITLALVLFHDAAQVRPGDIARDRALVARTLGIAFPLTLVLGFLLARVLFPDQPAMLSLLLAAALAPTDAGLGAATVLNPVVPVRVRRLLNVESGLNDGLATPVALFAIAALAGAYGLRPAAGLAEAVVEIGVGVAVGIAVGIAGGRLLGWSRHRDWSTSETRAMGVLGLPVLAFGGAELVHGNGFVSAYVAGTALAGAGASWLDREHGALHLTEVLTGPLGFTVWAVFGLVGVPRVLAGVGWLELLFALLSLTLLRMGPIALSLLGTGLRWPTLLFVGWFGPRGLVSVVFTMIAVESLVVDEALRGALSVVGLTVVLSVLAHGMSATPLAQRYGAWVAAHPGEETRGSPAEHARFLPQPRGSILRQG